MSGKIKPVGNRSARRGKPRRVVIPQAKRRVTIGDDIAVQIQVVAPGVLLKPLVEHLLVAWLIDKSAPLPPE